MNISQLAKAINVSTDTVRYYEKQGLVSAPQRQANGYRSYTDTHIELLRFVRGAQALGFSLAEIRALLPQIEGGTLSRADIEMQLQTKIAQIAAHIVQLKTLKTELRATFDALSCTTPQPVSTANATAPSSASGAGLTVARRAFAKRGALARSKK